jgi:hypothetical protein
MVYLGGGILLPPRHPPSERLRLFFEPNLFPNKYPTLPTPVTLHTYSPMKMEQTGCSETLVFKLQTPGNHPEENIQQNLLNFSLPLHIQYRKTAIIYRVRNFPTYFIRTIIPKQTMTYNEKHTIQGD